MADSSSLNKLPNLSGPQFERNPLEKNSLEKTVETLRQPIAIAVVASLGAHALLWFGLPLLSFEEDQTNKQRTVQVVELSPLERARLPQSTLSTPLPPSSKTNAKSKTTKSKPDDFLASLGIPSTPPAPPPPTSTPYYTIPPDLLTSSPSNVEDILPIKIKPSKPRKIDLEDALKKTRPETEALDQEEESQKTDKDPKKADPAKEKPPSNKASDLEGTQPADEPTPPAPEKPNELQALADLYAFDGNDPGLTDETALNNLKEFSEANGIGIYDWAKVEDMTIALPKEICLLKKAEQEELGEAMKQGVAIGAIVTPGQPTQAVILKSSGSKGLNKAAVEFIKNQNFQATEKTEKNNFLRFRVTFDPTQTDCTKVGNLDKPAS
jgi:TonB family protein